LVDVKRLDDIFASLCREHGIERPYLKMDTQGYDLNVLRGGAASLGQFVALQTEASVLAIYKDMPNWRQVVDYLGGVGFELSGVFPIITDERMRMIEFDCIMLRPKGLRAQSTPAAAGTASAAACSTRDGTWPSRRRRGTLAATASLSPRFSRSLRFRRCWQFLATA